MTIHRYGHGNEDGCRLTVVGGTHVHRPTEFFRSNEVVAPPEIDRGQSPEGTFKVTTGLPSVVEHPV